jgi:hypothetical protein
MQSIYQDLNELKVPDDSEGLDIYRARGRAVHVVGEVMMEAAERWAGAEYERLANELTPIPPAGEAVSR